MLEEMNSRGYREKNHLVGLERVSGQQIWLLVVRHAQMALGTFLVLIYICEALEDLNTPLQIQSGITKYLTSLIKCLGGIQWRGPASLREAILFQTFVETMFP